MKEIKLDKSRQGKITLLRHVAMPEKTLLKEVSIALRCTGVAFPEGIKVKRKETKEDERGIIKHFEFKQTPFIVRYKLDAQYDPKSNIDVAGNLNLKDEKSASDDGNEEKKEWLDQARSERSELQKTENGQKMLNVYNNPNHQKAYNLAFSIQAFADAWNDGGIVKAMAKDTSSALKNENAEINDKTYVFPNGKKVTYNQHAFDISKNLYITLMNIKDDTSFNPPGSSKYVPPDKMEEAADAIVNFHSSIYNTTNNDRDLTTPMKRKDIYKAINNASENNNIQFIKEKYNFEDEFNYYQTCFLKNPVNSVYEDKYGKGEFYRKFFSERLMRSDESKLCLHEGIFQGFISENKLCMDVLITKTNERTTNIQTIDISMPNFDIEVDNENWADEYRTMLEEKIQDISFVKQIVINALQEGFNQFVCGELARYENIRF